MDLETKDDIDVYISLEEDFFNTLIRNSSGNKEDLQENLKFLEYMKDHAKIEKEYIEEKSLKKYSRRKK